MDGRAARLLGVGGMPPEVTGIVPASLGACLLLARVLRLVDIWMMISGMRYSLNCKAGPGRSIRKSLRVV